MGYLIELSVNLKKVKNISQVKTQLYKKAEECKVEDYYSMFEFMGENRRVYRNHCVLTFLFTEHKELMVAFIKFVKSVSGVYIESLGYDNIMYKLLYASQKYLNMMDKFAVRKYLEDRKTCKIIQENSIILKAILKKK